MRIVEFVRGRRPTDEAGHPGLGSSDQVALLLGDAAAGAGNRAYILYATPAGRSAPALEVTLATTGSDGRSEPVTVPGWERRTVEPVALVHDELGRAHRRRAQAGDAVQAFVLEPDTDLAAVAGTCGFTGRFLECLRVELRLRDGERVVGSAVTTLDLCSLPMLGSLYDRVLERAIVPDTARQARRAGQADPGRAYHPWYPVLLIGGEKLALYTRALVRDIVDKRHHLTDPAWLLRVGIQLELLTALGIAEAVRDDVGDLLEPHERAAFEGASEFAPIREHVDADAWRSVWELREIAFPRVGTPRAGPVAATNLLRKKRATLRFLEVHHEDLKAAIHIAGANLDDAQETWQRVFRDAERAVLRKTADAFPELGFLPEPARELVLWQRRGRLQLRRGVRIPTAIGRMLTDWDGLFHSASEAYRASMNDVADAAKRARLMDHSGRECVPARVSLVAAIGRRDAATVRLLQRADSYAGAPEVADPETAVRPPLADAMALLREVPIFSVLSGEHLQRLAERARPLPLAPTQRLVIQGEPGTSLFVVADGEVEVMRRRSGGEDVVVERLARGEVVGEMSLLTGEPRSATVRAADGALVYEVSRSEFEPLLRANPQWIAQLTAIMDRRLTE